MSQTLESFAAPVLDPIRESQRLEALRSLHLLDTPREDRFDRVTRLASSFFQTPIAYVALIDSERQWFKSSVGVCMMQTSRGESFCQYTIHREEPFIIPDTLEHPIGRNHPLVVGPPYSRFYAGVPLRGPKGEKIGSFCIVDTKPRQFSPEDVAQLVAFAAIIEREVNLGQIIETQNELLNTRQKLVEAQAELTHQFNDAARYVHMMLPPPLSGEITLDWQFHPSTQLGGDGLGYRRINEDQIAFYMLDVTGHGLGSALLAVTALELLRNPAAVIDFSRPSVVIDRLNRTFQMEHHDRKFFSAWYGVYSRAQRTITYSNAGHPPAVLFDPTEKKLTRTASTGPVLGILPTFDMPEVTIDFSPGTELLLFTDGLYELLGAESGRGSYDEFVTWLESQSAAGKPTWETMLHWYGKARDKHAVDDDVTLMRFTTAA